MDQDQDTAMVFLTHLWPMQIEDGGEKFCKVCINEITCFTLNGYPVIGVYPYNNLPTIDSDNDEWPSNCQLVNNMIEHVQENYGNARKVFLALHDKHFGCSCIEMDITRYVKGPPCNLNYDIIKAVLFHHENDSYLYREFLSKLNERTAKDFYNSILRYIAQKPDIDRIYQARAEIMTPFIPFHLFWQLKNDSCEEEWKKILQEARKSVIEVFENDKFKYFLQLCGKNETEVQIEVDTCCSYKQINNVFFERNVCELMPAEESFIKYIEEFACYLETIIQEVEKRMVN